MINENQLEEFRKWFVYCENKFNGQRLDEFYKEMTYKDLKNLIDTCQALFAVKEAAEYVVRDRGYRIAANPHHAVELALQMDDLDMALTPFREDKK